MGRLPERLRANGVSSAFLLGAVGCEVAFFMCDLDDTGRWLALAAAVFCIGGYLGSERAARGRGL